MTKMKLAYICSLRNAAADRAGQQVPYKEGWRYMKSPLEYLAEALNGSVLGEAYTLVGVIHDDDAESPRDREKLEAYGFAWRPGQPWFYPDELTVQGRRLNDLFQCVPSSYRQLPRNAPERVPGKRDFERRLADALTRLEADVVLLDGLLVILDELVRPGSPFERRIVNIHPGITRLESPYERRGLYATLDALYGAQGLEVMDWVTMATRPVPALRQTGASFHYVDQGIDSGEVIVEVLNTDIDPADSILELRWNNFNNSLFPAMHRGLLALADIRTPVARPLAQAL